MMVDREETPLDGVEIALIPADAFEAPFYLADDRVSLDLEATATGATGTALFLAVDPAAGPFAVAADRGETACDGSLLGDPELIAIGVWPGVNTIQFLTCGE